MGLLCCYRGGRHGWKLQAAGGQLGNDIGSPSLTGSAHAWIMSLLFRDLASLAASWKGKWHDSKVWGVGVHVSCSNLWLMGARSSLVLSSWFPHAMTSRVLYGDGMWGWAASTLLQSCGPLSRSSCFFLPPSLPHFSFPFSLAYPRLYSLRNCYYISL